MDDKAKPSESIINSLKHFKREAFDPKNDGWVQNHYRAMLIDIKEFISSIENLELHK
tara:strand:+ start:1492 stop:1662 length:171 start_codon:yes stop_codon:yes gene_type:complete